MKRILLCLESPDDRQALADWLGSHGFALVAGSLASAQFDLCVIDRATLATNWQQVQARKQEAAFLPVLLLTPAGLNLPETLRSCIDDRITLPIDWDELHLRLEHLLRSRHYSQQLEEMMQRDRQSADRQAVLAALESRDRLQRLVDSSVIGIMIADLKGNILEANDAFLAMLGYSRAELEAGQLRWDDLTPSDYRSRDQQVIAEIQATGIFTHYEKEHIHKDGHLVAVQLGGALLDAAAQTVICFVLDISDRKRIEGERQQALVQAQEANLLKSRFVSLVSHEFRNPLNVISGTAQLLERYPDWPPDRQTDCFRRIQEAVNRMTDLLEDVLLVSRVEAGKLGFSPAPVPIEAFCDRLIEEFKLGSGSQYRLIFTVQGECGQPLLDAKLLRLILSNLLANAIKYSPAGSTVTLELMAQTKAIVFRVRDSGIGIPPTDQSRLFEAFFRAQNVGSAPGTGLGLTIAKQAIELHGGSIAVESATDQGTTFTVTLPA